MSKMKIEVYWRSLGLFNSSAAENARKNSKKRMCVEVWPKWAAKATRDLQQIRQF
jgi:hypothetical protein